MGYIEDRYNTKTKEGSQHRLLGSRGIFFCSWPSEYLVIDTLGHFNSAIESELLICLSTFQGSSA